jgi:hypothetical protein
LSLRGSLGSPYKIVSPLKPCLVPLETYCPECGTRGIMHAAHKPFLIGKVISFSISVNWRSAAFVRSCASLAPAYRDYLISAALVREWPYYLCTICVINLCSIVDIRIMLADRKRDSYENVFNRPWNWHGFGPSAGTPSRLPRLCTFSHFSQGALKFLFCRPQK